jgi:hypothetical protein
MAKARQYGNLEGLLPPTAAEYMDILGQPKRFWKWFRL